MVAHAIFCSSRRNGVQGIPFNDLFACLLGEFQDETWERVDIHYGGARMDASGLLEGCGGLDVSKLLTENIPFLTPPNAQWPSFFMESNRYGGCKFGHLVRVCNQERCAVYVQEAENGNGKAMLLCECKYWDKSVDMIVMREIIHGLDEKWEWGVVLVFCLKVDDLQTLPWENPSIGCVKISCHDGSAEWISQPAIGNRERLLIVVETQGQTKLFKT